MPTGSKAAVKTELVSSAMARLSLRAVSKPSLTSFCCRAKNSVGLLTEDSAWMEAVSFSTFLVARA